MLFNIVQYRKGIIYCVGLCCKLILFYVAVNTILTLSKLFPMRNRRYFKKNIVYMFLDIEKIFVRKYSSSDRHTDNTKF